ncbi:MAG: Uma2 family endonuclease [Hyphomicrobiaceae bacterium]
MTALPKQRRTVAEFMDWACRQERGRHELVHGEIVAMAPERAGHNRTKYRVVRMLDDAIRRAGVGCTAYTDGMTVVIDAHTAREPDALVQCGKPIDPDSLIADAPTIVVEVTSPSSMRADTEHKLQEYMTLASVQHYLIVDQANAVVVHHKRQTDGTILTRLVRDGEITLDPPGIVVDAGEMLADG